MNVFLHSENAEKQPSYVVTVAPAGDSDFVSSGEVVKDWTFADGRPKQIEVVFSYGAADVPDELGRYMTKRGIAHRTRLLRRVAKLFTREGHPIGEAYDETGRPVIMGGIAAPWA